MNKTITYGIIALGIGILFSSLSNNALAQKSAYLGLHEDQALVCIKQTETRPYNEVCKVVQILDLLDEQHENKLFADFGDNYDNDTFDIESLD